MLKEATGTCLSLSSRPRISIRSQHRSTSKAERTNERTNGRKKEEERKKKKERKKEEEIKEGKEEEEKRGGGKEAKKQVPLTSTPNPASFNFRSAAMERSNTPLPLCWLTFLGLPKATRESH